MSCYAGVKPIGRRATKDAIARLRERLDAESAETYPDPALLGRCRAQLAVLQAHLAWIEALSAYVRTEKKKGRLPRDELVLD